MEENKKRKETIYDQNGFRTDEFSHQVLAYLTDHEKNDYKVNKWKTIIPSIKELRETNERTLINYVREGIPDSLRKEVWPQLIMKPVKPYTFYKDKMECKQIDLDLDRTFPNNKIVKQLTEKMKSILNGIAMALPELGYCQGMNFIAAIILLKLDEEQAFDMMHHIFHWEKHEDLLKNLSEIHRKMFILESKTEFDLELIKKFYPKLHKKLKEWKIDCLFFASPWFITLFCNTLPCSYVLRILEIYLLEGEKILYRVALQILKIKKKRLKKLNEFEDIIFELKNFEDLTTTEEEIDNFVEEMFAINLSRKDLESLDREFEAKEKNSFSPVKKS